MKEKKTVVKDLSIDEKTHHQYRQAKLRQEQRQLEDIDRAIRNKDYSRLLDEDLY
jgi:hypothetical protein